MSYQALIKLILTFLKENKLYKSLLQIELETQTTLDSYTKEMHYLRMQILDGNFLKAEEVLHPLKTRLGEQFTMVMLELKKQQYFELINSKPDVEVLIQLLRQIEQITTPELYKSLCYFLTIPRINEHPDYSNWTIEKGRLECFDKIAQILKSLGKTFRIEPYKSLSLNQIYERYIHYQSAFNIGFEEEHDLIKEAKLSKHSISKDYLSKTQFLVKEDEENRIRKSHNRIKSNELTSIQQENSNPSSTQFYQSSKKLKQFEQDKNIIIEKLHISDISNHDEAQDYDQQSQQSFIQIKSQSSQHSQLQQSNQQSSTSQSMSSLFNYKFEEMVQVGLLKDSNPIRAAVFSYDGEMFAIGTNSKSLRIYSMKSIIDGQEQEISMQYEKPNHHYGSIYCIDWSRSGKFIATGSNDKVVKLFNYEEDIDISLQGHKGLVRTVCFSEESKLLSAGQDLIIKVWDVETQKCIRNLEGHTQPVYCIQTGGDGSFQVSVGMDRTLRLWDQRMGKPTAIITMQNEINYVSLSESQNNHNLQGLVKGTRKSLQFHNQGLAALAHSDGSISLWNLQQQKCVKSLKYHNLDCRCVEFDPTNRYLASASFDGTIGLYDIEQCRLITQIQNHEDRVVLCKWHPFYPFILSTSADKSGRIFAPQGFLVQLIKSFNFSQ